MKFIKPPRLELYSFLFSMPLIDVVINLIMYKERFWTDKQVWFISYPLIFVVGVCTWFLHVQYSHFTEQKFAELSQTRQRITWKLMAFLLVMQPAIASIFLA